MTKPLVLLSAFLVAVNLLSYSQCNLQSNGPDTVCAGEPFVLSAQAGCIHYLMNVNFNNANPGVGWTTCIPGHYDNPCGQGPGGTYLWVTGTCFPRELTTVPFHIDTGYRLCFDMVYGETGQAVPCAGISDPDQGVYLQYSTNGTTWNTIQYWPPDPDNNGDAGHDPVMTSWNEYCLDLPAYGVTTQIRWRQDSVLHPDSSQWGIDNIVLYKISEPVYEWTMNGLPIPGDSVTGAIVLPAGLPATFVVQADDGFVQISDTLIVVPVVCAYNDPEKLPGRYALFPNPVRDGFTVNGKNLHSIQVCDLTGRVVFSMETETSAVSHTVKLPPLSNGMYMVKLHTASGILTEKILIDSK